MRDWCYQGNSPIIKKEGYWYYITETYCPVCGKEETTKERRYEPRPKDRQDRGEVYDQYCGCMDYVY